MRDVGQLTRMIALTIVVAATLLFYAVGSAQSTQAASATFSPTPTQSATPTNGLTNTPFWLIMPTARPGEMRWTSLMLPIPDATDETYKYLPPEAVIAAIRADWDIIATNCLYEPDWLVKPETYKTCLWIERVSTPTAPPPTLTKVPKRVTPDLRRGFVFTTIRTFRLLGCNATGDLCQVSEKREGNILAIYDANLKETSRQPWAKNYIQFGNLRFDTVAGHWKQVGLAKYRQIADATTTPTAITHP